MVKGIENNDWIRINPIKKLKDGPSEIRIDIKGRVYIDGKLYDEAASEYGNLTIDVENHNKMNLGEETQKIIESSKKAKRGETVVIKDIKGPDITESTTVKF